MSVAPFVPSSHKVVKRMLELAEVKSGEVVYDLGCGDGRIVIMAARDFGAKAVGIELREDLVRSARKAVKEQGLEDRVEIIQSNFFEVDISPADVVTLYLTTSGNDLLKSKLEKELKKGARVVSHEYPIRGWNPKLKEKFVEPPSFNYFMRRFPVSHTLYLYQL